MKILFVGVFGIGSTNVSQAEAFERLGHKVIRYDYRQLLKMTFGNVADRDRNLREEIWNKRPDLTVFSKCNQMDVSCVEAANKVGVSCLWYMDPKNSNFTEELIRKIKAATFSCFAHLMVVGEALLVSPDSRCYFVPEGYDEKVDFPVDAPGQIFDVSFIGNTDLRRAELCKLAGALVLFTSFGRQHAEVVSRSKINLNLTYGDECGPSDRVYKILAAGGFLLTESWVGMEELFKDGQHLVVFRGPADLKAKVRYYLTHEDERRMIAYAGHLKNEPNSRTTWARRIVEIAEK